MARPEPSKTIRLRTSCFGGQISLIIPNNLAHQTTPTLGYRTEAFSSEEMIELYKKMKRELEASA